MTVITALTSAVTPTQIITLLAGLIAFGIVYVFMWFGVRKLLKSLEVPLWEAELLFSFKTRGYLVLTSSLI